MVGGIYDKPPDYRAKHQFTPETVLAEGLRLRGVTVTTVGHRAFRPSRCFDIVHVHHLGRAALRMACRLARSHFVFTSHDGPIVCGVERSIRRRAAYRVVVRRADGVVALSEYEARRLRRITAGRSVVAVIPNGVESRPFRLRLDRAGTRDGRYVLQYVGHMSKRKGVDALLRATAMLARRWPVRLDLAYQTADDEPSLRRLSAELGLDEIVIFSGFLPATEVIERYRRAAVVVLPSLAECLPSTVTEALLCGTPVVATGVGGVPDQLGHFGRIVPPGDVCALAGAIDGLLRSLPDEMRRAEQRRSYAATRFAPDVMVVRHLELYEQICTDRRQPVSGL